MDTNKQTIQKYRRSDNTSITVIEDALQAKKVTLAVFIDLQKAFDKVWKNGHLVKMLRSGISKRMYKWTKSYLNNTKARDLIGGQFGKKVLLRQGVPQGGVLSTTLFILYMNDLVPEIPKAVHAALYAKRLCSVMLRGIYDYNKLQNTNCFI